MEVGTFFSSNSLSPPVRPSRRYFRSFPQPSIRFSLDLQKKNKNGSYKGPKPKRDWLGDWVSRNDVTVRSLPIYVGGVSLLAVLFNRAVSGIAPVADAGSSQSRADLLALGLAVTNVLTGLVWLSIRPKSISVVNPQGVECQDVCSDLPTSLVYELLWLWDSLSAVTCCRSLVVVYEGSCLLQTGVAAESAFDEGLAVSVDATALMEGSLYKGAMRSGTQSYLANLSLYPGRSQLPFLPGNTQAVILQPLGDKGIAIIGGNMVRGFTTSDQAWITLIAEKLDATLSTNLAMSVQEAVES
ncbi:hypothetical protein MKW94_001497 [Papaver nudicaule]|uniref:Protein COFACTOR ASSEMBLY OF COMPLEX C SUBUNIT B CCB4, chloroplastic n=1 Tax=Papaver nudicaule TaxID=74823 RepID=A0AA41VHH7_PAPNU|nr:hypothetical protein [Papaver nudicaule]